MARRHRARRHRARGRRGARRERARIRAGAGRARGQRGPGIGEVEHRGDMCPGIMFVEIELFHRSPFASRRFTIGLSLGVAVNNGNILCPTAGRTSVDASAMLIELIDKN